MEKFQYKKLVDTYVFYHENNGYVMSVRCMATHVEVRYADYPTFFHSEMPFCVAMSALGFMMCCNEEEIDLAKCTQSLYFDGHLYTWHIDKYKHIIFRIYRVVK